MSRCEAAGARRAALALLLLLAACRQGFPTGAGATGELDLARLVAIGDGYLAGVTDGALFASAQETSIPALFVRHAAPSTDFQQPLISDPGLATDQAAGGRLTLVSSRPLGLARLARGEPLALGLDRPYDNLAVPDAFLTEALVADNSGASLLGNEFYDLVLRGRGTFAEQAAERDATMILLWLGTEDVATFVLQGGDRAAAPGLPTPVGTFTTIYETLLDRLEAVTGQIVLFNIPDPTLLPAVHAVPNVVLDPATGDTLLITISEPVIDPATGQQKVDSLGNPIFVTRQAPLPLVGPEGPLGSPDLVTLAALPLIAEGIGIPTVVGGTGDPLPDRVVLDAEEIATARAAVAAYNAEIDRIGDARGLAVVDIHGLVEEMATTGVVSDGILLTTEWLFGQAFSLDGVSFTPKGYGVVTNLLIDTVNARYGSRLRHIRTADLPGIPLFGR
jgi:hypothetical protein